MPPQLSTHTIRPRWWHRFVKGFAASRVGSWLFGPVLHRLDAWLLKRSGGRTTLSEILSGVPIVTVTTIGAKSNQPRTTPLLALPDDDGFILIASNWGKPHHPAWYYNLKAHPTAQITYRNHTATYRARLATPSEREHHWNRALQLYPGYNAYKARAGSREIPLFVLTPVK